MIRALRMLENKVDTMPRKKHGDVPTYEIDRLFAHAGHGRRRDRYPVGKQAKVEPEILRNFTTLLKIDTSNAQDDETAAANTIKALLEREGIACKLFALNPARANVVARVKGTGAKKPILLMGHTDVR